MIGSPPNLTEDRLQALVEELHRAGSRAGWIRAVKDHRVHGLAVLLAELGRLDESSGTAFDFELPLSPEAIETLSALRDMVRENQKLQEQAVTDTLTGLFNIRFFRERLRVEMERVGRTERPCSLVMSDLDKFKPVNDRYGHPAGDELLRVVADRLRSGVRAVDTAVRYGGDETALILPDTGTRDAVRIANRIRESIARDPLVQKYGVTASMGVATHHPYGSDTADSLVHRADQALYEAKRQGGNRVWVFETDHAPEAPTAVTSGERDDLFAALALKEEE